MLQTDQFEPMVEETEGAPEQALNDVAAEMPGETSGEDVGSEGAPLLSGAEQIYATGRRKTAVARVWLRRGKGRFIVNRMPLDEYFNCETHRMIVKQPMRLTKNLNDFDVLATAYGGGKSAQAEALKHGISRALAEYNPTENRPVLKKSGFLTRDSRMKERKKYGQRGARARFQFSKR